MLEFFANIFNVYWAVFFVSMVPAVESKIAIPFGMSTEIWGETSLSVLVSCFMAFLGTALVSLFVILVFKFVKKKTCGVVVDSFVDKFKTKYKSKFKKLDSKTSTFKKCLLLSVFVAIPLPLTGAYSGSVIAGISNLKFWQGFLSVLVGEMVSCVIVALLCTIFENSVFYILMISLAICLVYIVLSLSVSMALKIRNKKRKEM